MPRPPGEWKVFCRHTLKSIRSSDNNVIAVLVDNVLDLFLLESFMIFGIDCVT